LLIALVTRTSPISAHEWSRLATVESLVERQTYELDGSSFANTRDKIFNRGHFYSHQPPLLATIEAPIYGLLHAAGLRFANNAPFDWAFYLFVLFTNGLAFALTVVVLDSVFALAAIPGRTRAFYALVLPLGTWLFPYGAVTNNHGIAALLLAFALYQLLAIEVRGGSVRRCWFLGGGLGVLSAIEILPLVSYVPLVAVYVARRDDRRRPQLVALGAAFLLPLVAHAALNIPITGDVVPAGFHFELFNYPGSPFDASTLSGDVKMRPLPELLHYATEAMFTRKGFFTLAPVMLIGLLSGVLGWTWWRRFRGVHVILVAGTLASLTVSLLTTNNFGGVAVGFRHATYLAPAFLILLLPVLASRQQWGRAAAAAIGVLAAGSAVVLIVYAVRWPWEDLVFPLSKPLGPWQSYIPVVGHVLTNVP